MPDGPLAERADLALRRRQAWRIELAGHVQGVGFRPFVYRLATELGLCGEVQNRLGTVRVLAQGETSRFEEFCRRLIADAPPLSRPEIKGLVRTTDGHCTDFRISDSSAGDAAQVFLPPDYYMCADCRNEQADPTDRRFCYPFINCTQCGPRYTLIRNLPYDRPNTSMDGFPMCEACRSEYTDPADRRFHAEPIACPDCGPQVHLDLPAANASHCRQGALDNAIVQLRRGKILAVKGIGGYHLMCDASNADAVRQLRKRKHRPDKPLAVMFPQSGDDGLASVRNAVLLSTLEAELVCSAARPVVLAQKKMPSPLAENLAPGLAELGVFLPYSPLHQLLLDGFDQPLVATSGNISGEPVLTDNCQATTRLAGIADGFLHHDRPIVRPADDPVFRRIAHRPRPLRLGRGIAPLELQLPWHQAQPVICVGGHMKNTVTLSWDNRAVVSPHIGEMDSPRSLAVFEQVQTDLQALYGVEATRIACDAHRGYATTRWASRQEIPVIPIWHHRAHASALAGELALPGPWLAFTWDGVGLGEDGTLWGGEALLGEPGNWRRVCSLRPFRPPGGDRAGREPWRSAAALAWEAGLDWDPDNTGLARQAWDKQLNSPQTSAAGRLFDAAAAFICGTQNVSFEAQGPMQLEALCRKAGKATALPLYDDGPILRSNWAPLLDDMRNAKVDPRTRAENFHSSMAQVIVDQAVAVRERHRVQQVGLVGGVFQNRCLTELAQAGLVANGFDVHLAGELPCNDGALSFGQAAELAALCDLQSRPEEYD